MTQGHAHTIAEQVDATVITVHVLLHDLDMLQRQNVNVSRKSKFKDNRWDFSEEFPTTHLSETRCDFDLKTSTGNLTDKRHSRLLDAFKCLAYSLLYDPPHVGVHFPTVARAIKKGHGLGNLFIFMADSGMNGLVSISADDFEDFLTSMTEQPHRHGRELTNGTLLSRVKGIEWIHLQRDKLSDCFSFKPWREYRTAGLWARSVAVRGESSGQLKTQPWSDTLIAALVKCALAEVWEAEEKAGKLLIAKDEAVPSRWGAEQKAAYVRIRSAVGLLAGNFSGMRVTELQSMRADVNRCCSVDSVRNGEHESFGYFLHGILSKLQPVPRDEKWQTIPVVHAAIKTLASVNAKYLETRAFLFCSSSIGAKQHGTRQMSTQAFVVGLNQLAKHHRVDLSELNGRISAFDMRRTFARTVTRNGLGIVELQDQMKHFDPDLTMQYGAPGLKEHLEVEKQNFTKDQYRELLTDTDLLIGGGASEIVEARVVFSGLTRGEKQKFLESLPSAVLIDQTEDGLCLYRPDRALCGGDKWACKPADCKNSVIPAEEYMKTVAFRKEENTRLLKFYSRQPAKREHLKAQLAVMAKLEAQMQEAQSVPGNLEDASSS